MDAERFEKVEVRNAAQLWAWLGARPAGSDSVWLITWKAARPQRYVSREEVLDALIAHGWIDGRRMKLDQDRTMQLISPRRQQAWADSYKRRAERLEAEGRMTAMGRAAVDAGRASGLWDSMAAVEALTTPDDLAAALSMSGGGEWWSGAAPSYRRNVLRWIETARKAETRAKRVSSVADHAGRGRKVPQF